MSDGTIVYSDDCYRQGIAEKGVAECPGGGFAAVLSDCPPGGIKDLSKIPHAEGGTCANSICGYGYDENGNPNPTSGEIQLMHGCEKGYIDDPDKCAAVASMAEQYGW
ncbi:hypothetical protein [Corynebacterium sp. LK2510]|uniref:hypothetical protein n=1 Tax=Corynebacterium sp. LK2510 TaxID=3110472 RepID=UPI0034CD4A79